MTQLTDLFSPIIGLEIWRRELNMGILQRFDRQPKSLSIFAGTYTSMTQWKATITIFQTAQISVFKISHKKVGSVELPKHKSNLVRVSPVQRFACKHRGQCWLGFDPLFWYPAKGIHSSEMGKMWYDHDSIFWDTRSRGLQSFIFTLSRRYYFILSFVWCRRILEYAW